MINLPFKNNGLDHIAICVKNLDQASRLYSCLGFRFADKEIVSQEGVEVAMAEIVDPNGPALEHPPHLELICPLNQEEGALANFLKKRGEGLHHLCFRVDDVKESQRQLENQGWTFIYTQPREGAGKKQINFIHPKWTHGVLIELSS